MSTDKTPYESLKELIEVEKKQKERECGKFLDLCKDLLVIGTPIAFIHSETEYRGNTGDSDYIVSCKTRDGTSLETNNAYIWELKAPQCYIFEADTRQRLIPSKDLIKAENQLFHYFHEYRGSIDFHSRFEVHPNNIHIGGIIIGTKERYVKGNYEPERKTRLYSHSLMIRKEYVYRTLGLQIFTWDRILEQIKEQKTDRIPYDDMSEAISAHSGSVQQDIEIHE